MSIEISSDTISKLGNYFKLCIINIYSGYSCLWFASYLSDDFYCVSVCPRASRASHISCAQHKVIKNCFCLFSR